jgi:putative PIN family toxin of toxin-antitoxin system
MIKVVADTNVYVSAIVFGGTWEALLALARAGIVELVVSPALLRELRAVLIRTFGWTETRTREAQSMVTGLATVIRSRIRLSKLVTAEADHRVLECAVASKADYLVTGDKRHLLPLRDIRGVPIVSPGAFLKELQRRNLEKS